MASATDVTEQTAIQVTKFDPANFIPNVVTVTAPVPTPGPDEVVVRMALRPINPADIFSVMGVNPSFQPSLPAVPGLDGMGRVATLGKDCKKLTAGQRVAGFPWPTAAGNGSWQQFLVAKESNLVAVPDYVSDEFAAVVYVNPVAVMGLLDVAAVPSGEYLLVTAAGSAVAHMLIPLATHKGIKVVGTVRRKDQLETFKDIGAAALVCTEDSDWPQQVRAITGGKGVYATLDCVSGKMMGGAVAATRNGGSVYNYGAMDGIDFTTSSADLLFRNIHLRGFYVVRWFKSLSPERQEAVIQEIWDLHRQGLLTSPVDKVYPLEEVQEALKDHLATGRTGKIMLRG